MFTKNKKGFSLIELLVVISVISLLMAILIPALVAARSQARGMVCKSNLRQLFIANAGYATENKDNYVWAAPDITSYKGGNHRWHGIRNSPDEPFDPLKGPLAAYLNNGMVKECPGFAKPPKDLQWEFNFEQGCGGYGYNDIYLGSRNWQDRTFTSIEEIKSAAWETTKTVEVRKPAKTLMFADAAMAMQQNFLIEYSFAKPPFIVYKGEPVTNFYMSPSIHFRHRSFTNVVWTDGHVSPEHMADVNQNNVYSVDSAHMKLGWFEPVDNTFFDLK